MSYKFDNAHEWLDYAVKNGKIGTAELLTLIHNNVDSDEIQFNFQEEMDDDGYFDKN